MKATLKKSRLKRHVLELKLVRERNRDQYSLALTGILGENSFDFIDVEMLEAGWIFLSTIGIESKAKAMAEGGAYFDVKDNIVLFMDKISRAFLNFSSERVLIYPLEWRSIGGFYIETHDFFRHLEEIMYIFDDDLKVFSEDLDNALYLSGDRINKDLYLLELVSFGKKWDNLLG
ncbi:hypothetical protein ACJJI3_19635 [Microbulbifer sp. ZKSA004]|uniref:hypothetical protein n=1 Tax=Microbulbifer sp. ZKSA004 TaxID=3243389 RepID=UPI00403A5912